MKSASGSASMSMLMNTQPAQVSRPRTGVSVKSLRSICGKSHSEVMPRKLPSRVPAEAVKRTDEAGSVAGPVAKAAAPVAADVVVRPDAFGSAHHDDRVAADVIDPVVAHLGNLLLPAGHLPDPGPEALHLQVMEGLAGVAGHRHGDQRRAEDVLQGQGLRVAAPHPGRSALGS